MADTDDEGVPVVIGCFVFSNDPNDTPLSYGKKEYKEVDASYHKSNNSTIAQLENEIYQGGETPTKATFNVNKK